MEPGTIPLFGLGWLDKREKPVFIREPRFWLPGVFGQVRHLAGGYGDHVEEKGSVAKYFVMLSDSEASIVQAAGQRLIRTRIGSSLSLRMTKI